MAGSEDEWSGADDTLAIPAIQVNPSVRRHVHILPRTPPSAVNDLQNPLLLSGSDITSLLPMVDCIAAVEAAFVMQARGETIASNVLGTHVTGGGFHLKTAGLRGTRAYFAAKINANFPGNAASGLPT